MTAPQPARSPRGPKPWLARATLIVVGLLVAVVTAEVSLRIFGIGYGGVHMATSDVLHHEHPRDYRFVSYHRSREYGGHTVFFDNAGRRANPENPQGRRASPEHLQFDQTDSEVSVVVMGDSFVEALQVAHEESFVGRLQNAASPNVSVENYGTSSYSPALYLLQWRTRIRDRAPTHVFLMLFGNDIRNDEEMTAIAELDTSGDIVAVSGAKPGLFDRVARMTYLGRLVRKVQLQLEWMWDHRQEERNEPAYEFVEEDPEMTDLTDRYLRQLVGEVTETGAQVVLMAVPSRERTLRPTGAASRPVFHDIVRDWADRQVVPFVDLSTPFAAAAGEAEPLFFARDIHFTAHGHRVVADTLLAAYPEVFGRTVDAKRTDRP